MENGSGSGRVKFGQRGAFNSVKVFSATMMQDREQLGDAVTEWIGQHPTFEVTEIIVTQSSDEAFHCLAMTVFYFDPSGQ